MAVVVVLEGGRLVEVPNAMSAKVEAVMGASGEANDQQLVCYDATGQEVGRFLWNPAAIIGYLVDSKTGPVRATSGLGIR
jgi:hypothetical protein